MAPSEISAIMAGGPSMTPAVVEAVRAAGIRSVVINNSWMLMPDADCLFAADAEWWLAEPRVSPTDEQVKGQRLVCQDQRVPNATYVVPNPQPIGMNGSNSALQAAYYEAKRGAKRILLFGVDLRDDELTHHHGLHKGTLNNPTKQRFRRARAAWAAYAAEPNRPEIINCNPRSALDCFPKMTMEEALGLS